METLEDFYGRSGYLDTRVRLVRKANLGTGNIDIEYQIEESQKFYVESIKIEGNTKTKSIVVIRELILGPGDVFDTVRMKASKMRLQNTNFFEDVNLTPESTQHPRTPQSEDLLQGGADRKRQLRRRLQLAGTGDVFCRDQPVQFRHVQQLPSIVLPGGW